MIKNLPQIVLLNIVGLALFLSWYIPVNHGFWLPIDADIFYLLNLQSKCNKKRSTHQLEYNFVSTQKPFPNDEYFLPTSYNKRA
ncbi:hypothetical protein OIU02_05555, partial [Escherichia coli]|nr:hypothetical protein [Escherichia coli]